MGRHNLIQLYSLDSLSRATLLATNSRYDARIPGAPSREAVPLVVMPHQQQTFIVHVVSNDRLSPFGVRLFTLLDYKDFLNDSLQIEFRALAFHIGMAACLLFMSLFAIGQYLTNRDNIYVWYSLYVLATCLFFLRLPETVFQFDEWLYNQFLVSTLMPISQLAMHFFYMLFFGTLLELPRYQPRLWLWYRYLLIVLTALMATTLIVNFSWGGHTYIQVYNSRLAGVITVLVLLSETLLAGLALRGRHPLRSYAVAGFLLLMSGALSTYIVNGIDIHRISVFVRMPSILLEVFCFSLALGRRTRLIELEKNRIQQRYSQDLETQLAQREQEIEQQSRLIEAQHIRQLESEFEQKLADTEMTALRAQMNPHFIFNCLNSIKLYTLQNNADKASDYLTKFSRLIRLVLENSRAERVTLQNELDALQLYIELEAMRFKQKVQFSIHVSPGIDQRYVCIPPLLLQPYVENAIWHGLMHKPEGGTVTVEVSQPQPDQLHIEITDDGVGRQRAGALKSKSAGSHKSFGMQVTADRIRMINQLYNIQTQTQIVDLVDSFGEACGTRVLLDIPI